MEVKFRKSFERDLKRIKDSKTLNRIKEVINEIKQADNLWAFKGDIRKLKQGENFWRIRVGEYRIGLEVNNDVVMFVRVLSRRDIYKYFP